MTSRPAVHLSVRRGGVACGMPKARITTQDPTHVTCGGCKRTVDMADAEILWARTPRRKR